MQKVIQMLLLNIISINNKSKSCELFAKIFLAKLGLIFARKIWEKKQTVKFLVITSNM